ncbi:piezo-type mechanosensitive ion channel component 1-like [Ylistrum balloti]|uniref:piezo-type mechanosensitive ion channel component 1-like n=1 Tax=Ylistrum balloti TaxID=509963 RepID=UPI002905CDA2|nr:piezo-type mechanosensitive ion channel component 1-like [Ylistrum balloti]
MTTQVSKWVCYPLFRVLLPIILLAACAVRYNALSFIYLVFLLAWPLLPTPNRINIKGNTGVYLKCIIVVSALGTLAHIAFHIALAAGSAPYGSVLQNCSTAEKVARQIAVERLDGVPFLDILRLVFPDVFVLIVSVLVFVVCYKLLAPQPTVNGQEEISSTATRTKRKRPVDTIVSFLGEFAVAILLAASGIIVPSAIGAFYFLSFLYIATWWAFYKSLGSKFSYFKIVIVIWSGLHLLLLHLYQFQFFQEAVSPELLISRILGLTGVIQTNCSQPWTIEYNDPYNWPHFVNPAIILALYVTAAAGTRQWINRKRCSLDETDGLDIEEKQGKRRRTKPTERQVAHHAQEGQTEHLVTAGEGPSYSSFDPVGTGEGGASSHPDSGSPTMSVAFESEDEADGGGSSKPSRRKNWKRPAMVSFLVYVMKQSYVLTLIAMMAWSITFHSWLTFVMLLSACFIWMFPSSRRVCLMLSPVIVFYGEGLLIIQYVYGFDLPDELPEQIGKVKLSEVGLQKFPYPCLQLALQLLFTFTFWMTMRQFMRERAFLKQDHPTDYALNQLQQHGANPTSIKSLFTGWIQLSVLTGGIGTNGFPLRLDSVDGYDSNTIKDLGSYIWSLLSKYWIFVCAGMLLLISIQDVVIYRIIYLVFFLYFIMAFQVSYKLWRLTMFGFWWAVIIYSMCVLIMLYTYQFSDFPDYWRNGTGLSDEVLSDIGLEIFDTAGLFEKLLTPTSFLILIILQVHYFHKPFLLLSDLERHRKEDLPQQVGSMTTDTEGTSDSEGVILKRTKKMRRRMKYYFLIAWSRCSAWWSDLSRLLWRIAQIHIFKVIAFTIFMVVIQEISAISAVYVILLGIFLPLTAGWKLMSLLCQLWTSTVLLSKTIYQLNIVEKDYWISNCSMVGGNVSGNNTTNVINPFINGTIDNAEWVGFDKTDKLSAYLKNHIAILLLIAFERIVFYHQQQHYNRANFVKPPRGIIFPEIRRPDADKNLVSCAKFLANYFFYKFGLEICYVMFAITISVRVDAYSVLYAAILGTLLFLSRRRNATMWPLFTVFIAILLPLQYVQRLGLPTGLCIEYPWPWSSDLDAENLDRWLVLPNYFIPQWPEARKLVADFFLLLFMALQWQVFRKESGPNMATYGGGDNYDILLDVEANVPNPVEDFTSVVKSYLDIAKSGFFVYMYWATMFIVFLAGVTRINIFSMGYMIAVFCFMWYGQEFLLKPLRNIRKSWNLLIGYNFAVLFLKAALQLLGCVYINKLYDGPWCWLVQLLGLTCLTSTDTTSSNKWSTGCTVEEDDTGLMWDVICFTFLLLQLRIYNSHYFRHVVSSSEAQNRLASRGAELINIILVQYVKQQKEDEQSVLQGIKMKMESLKEKQKAKVRKDYVETEEHFQAIRSGDYYLFDEEVEKEDKRKVDSVTFGEGKPEEEDGRLSPTALISAAITSGAGAAVDMADEADEKESGQKAQMDKDDQLSDDQSDKETYVQKSWNLLRFMARLLESFADWLIEMCNDISKNYRMVASTLEEEMKEEKKKINAERSQITTMDEHRLDLDFSGDEDGADATDGQPTSDMTELVEIKTETELKMPSAGEEESDSSTSGKSKFERSKPKIFLLFEACYYLIISRSEMVCYFLMILNQILNASLLSLPLPLMVFLWGMLSVPRPSKTFWITIITYTEAIIVVKYLFQFGFFTWNDGLPPSSPFWPPRIIGIEKKDGYAYADLVLLLALFIHRTILKRYGLWKDAEDIDADFKEVEKVISRPSSPLPEDDADVTNWTESTASTSLQVTSIEDSGQDDLDQGKKKKSKRKKKYFQPFTDFYEQLTNEDYNATIDVYASMFFCDFINFLIVLFGYQAFGPAQSAGGGDVTSYLRNDRVPVTFLFMLVTQFILIIVDRALYLRKNVMGKFIFQIFLVAMIHIWLFFILPSVTERKFSENIPAQLWYFMKCIYFGLSAYQIRSSYPTRILGNFLTKKYNYLNLFLFKGFLAIPFLLELRVLMDWIWTDTTMAIGSWLQMEDIYANIYVLKCWREAERKYPTPRGQKKRSLVKYGMGGSLLVLVIFIIWFPLVIFSLANTVFVPNPPIDCTVTIAIGGFQPLFKMTAQSQAVSTLTSGEYNYLRDYYSNNREALGFLSNYEAVDITKISLNGKSTSVWGISPPSQQELITTLKQNTSSNIEFYVSFTRTPSSSAAGESLSNEFTTKLDPSTQNRLASIVENMHGEKVDVTQVFPRFIHLPSKGRAVEVRELLFGSSIQYSNVSLSLRNDTISEWWQAQEVILGDNIFSPSSDETKKRLVDNLTLISFNDRVAPEGFSFITGYGIIGLYITFILVIGRILRLSTTGLVELITYRELPYVDNILQLCLDLYLVREMREYRLEEDLYAKLLFVYRSSETRITWTQLPRRLIVTQEKKND